MAISAVDAVAGPARSTSGCPPPGCCSPGRGPRDHLEAHPATAVLVVEVADRSLAYDHTQKAALYAQAGIPEYWLVDVQQKTLAVHREPEGDAYRSRTVLGLEDTISPLARPDSPLKVADLLA